MKRRFAILYLIICILLLSGCGGGGIYTNYKEVEQLQLVRIMGLDRKSEDEVCLTVSSGKTCESGSNALLSITAPSVTLASKRLHDFASSKLLFYDHTKCVLFGEDTLREGIEEFLAYMERSTEMRMSIELFVVRGDTAVSLMGGNEDSSYDISEVMDSVQRDMRLRGDTHAFTCAETARALSEHGAALICALQPANTTDIVRAVEAGTIAVPKGFGILKGGQLVGFLTDEEAQAACLITETGALSTLTLTDKGHGTATVVLESCRCQVTPHWSEKGLERVELSLKTDAALTELSVSRKLDDSSYLDDLSKLLEQELEECCEKVLERSRELSADFLGLGRKLRAKDAKRYDALDTDWLGDTTFVVTVSAKVGRAGDLGDSVSSEGGGMLSVPAQ